MPEAKRFEFKLDNAYGEGRYPVTVDPKLVTVTYLDEGSEAFDGNGEIYGVEFSFPRNPASDLYPEESYTVTVNMMFRPGVAAGVESSLTNEFYVRSDSQFAGCNFDAHHETAECRAETEVYPTEAGALRGKKYVRANDTELRTAIVANPNSVAECKPAIGSEPDGFYVGSCVPITKPLGIETWREELQNTGTTAMEQVVTIDSLPKVGDQGVHVAMPRNSQWQPTWVGNLAVVTDTLDGAAYRDDVKPTVFYSDSEGAACEADLKPTQTPQCGDFWQPLDGSVDPLTVRHVKTVFTFPDGRRFAPGERLAYTFETRTPAQAPKMTADTVAWNSVAVGARTVGSDGQTRASVVPTEGLRVGVALATGPLAIEKTVAGNGAHFAPETFQVDVVCEVPAREGAAGPVKLDPVRVTVAAGEPVTLNEQFPYGAKCRVAEVPGANGETSSEIPDDIVEIGRDKANVPVLQLTNHYELGSLTLTKTVDGALNQDGEPIDYGSFPVAAECSFLGTEIALDASERTADLAHGESWTIDGKPGEGLPVGTVCKITEVDAKGATPTLTVDGKGVEADADGSWLITVAANAESTPTHHAAVELVNSMPVAALSLEKQLAGLGAAGVADPTVFSFGLVCVLGDETVYDGSLTLTKAEAVAGTTINVDKLPVGAECELTETGAGGATSTALQDAAGNPVTGPFEITADGPLSFVAVNTFDAGSLHVQKLVEGDGAELWGAGPFEVSLACSLADNEVAIPGGATRELTAATGLAADYTDLPAGASCELSETGTGGATTSAIVDAEGEAVDGPIKITAGATAELRVVNTFSLGALTVTKKLTGAGASLAGDKTFTVDLACTLDRNGTAVAIEVPGGATRTLSKQGGLTASYDQLPVGAACELRETGTAGGKTVSITPNSGDALVGTVVVAAGAATKLTVVNEFPAVPPVPGIPETGGGIPVGLIAGGVGLLVLGAVLVIVRLRRSKSGD